ncbi:hypothetical protein MTO96_003843 [Rhipicephalus appendiculatus]
MSASPRIAVTEHLMEEEEDQCVPAYCDSPVTSSDGNTGATPSTTRELYSGRKRSEPPLSLNLSEITLIAAGATQLDDGEDVDYSMLCHAIFTEKLPTDTSGMFDPDCGDSGEHDSYACRRNIARSSPVRAFTFLKPSRKQGKVALSVAASANIAATSEKSGALSWNSGVALEEAEVAESSQPPARLPLRSQEQHHTPAVVHGRQFERMQLAERGHQSTEVLRDGSVVLRSGNARASMDPFLAAWDSWYDQNRQSARLCLRVLRYCAPVLLVTVIVLGVIFWMATHGFRYALQMPSPRVKASV